MSAMTERALPAPGWLPDSWMLARNDGPGWRPVTYLNEPPLTAAEVARLRHYRPIGGARTGLPLLAVDEPTGLAAHELGGHWKWMDYVPQGLPGCTPLDASEVADLVEYVAVTR